ncbi:hypothetical protein TNCV_4146021 [Trichonephila clavipes]|nr:hypothetical protein TNCV_4146021 [Trichonephila clavipes]
MFSGDEMGGHLLTKKKRLIVSSSLKLIVVEWSNFLIEWRSRVSVTFDRVIGSRREGGDFRNEGYKSKILHFRFSVPLTNSSRAFQLTQDIPAETEEKINIDPVAMIEQPIRTLSLRQAHPLQASSTISI